MDACMDKGVDIYAWIYAWTLGWINAWTHAWIYAWAHAWIYAWAHACMDTGIYIIYIYIS